MRVSRIDIPAVRSLSRSWNFFQDRARKKNSIVRCIINKLPQNVHDVSRRRRVLISGTDSPSLSRLLCDLILSVSLCCSWKFASPRKLKMYDACAKNILDSDRLTSSVFRHSCSSNPDIILLDEISPSSWQLNMSISRQRAHVALPPTTLSRDFEVKRQRDTQRFLAPFQSPPVPESHRSAYLCDFFRHSLFLYQRDKNSAQLLSVRLILTVF